MRNAHYLRGQAALYLAIARQVSDRADAERMRAEAAGFIAEAEAIEAKENAAPPPAARSGDDEPAGPE